MRRHVTKRRVLIFVPVALLLAAFLAMWLYWVGPGPSTHPTRIIRAASPIECAPVEQAVTTAWFGPISPYLMLT